MTLITKKEVAQLHDINQENCISIFIPTHRAGKEVLQEKDSLFLKNQLKDVKDKLSKKGLSNDQITDLTLPVQQLIDNSSFWREQSDGLAIFLADGFFERYTLPIYFKEYNHISNSFYLKPLMPMFVGDGSYYLLLLERRNVKLYECTKHSFTEIIIDDLIPESKRDRVGFDFEEKNLQFRSGGSGEALYHGQEAATGQRKNEIKKYLRAINDGLAPLVREESMPMIIAAQDPVFDIYKEVNTYQHFMEENITADFSNTDIFEIHELAWEKMESVFDQQRKDTMEQFLAEQGKGKTSTGIAEILPAAVSGKIEALFCENKEDIFGEYKEENGAIKVVQREEGNNTVSLMNMAAIKTFLNGGAVYLLEKEEMPNPNSRVNALFRF